MVFNWKVSPYTLLETNLALYTKMSLRSIVENIALKNVERCWSHIKYLRWCYKVELEVASNFKRVKSCNTSRKLCGSGNNNCADQTIKIVEIRLWTLCRSNYKDCVDQSIKIAQVRSKKSFGSDHDEAEDQKLPVVAIVDQKALAVEVTDYQSSVMIRGSESKSRDYS